MKIVRVTPILKPDQIKTDKTGYRPISNLHSLENFFGEHIKEKLVNHLGNNKIIDENHHGGKKLRSRITSKAAVDNE